MYLNVPERQVLCQKLPQPASTTACRTVVSLVEIIIILIMQVSWREALNASRQSRARHLGIVSRHCAASPVFRASGLQGKLPYTLKNIYGWSLALGVPSAGPKSAQILCPKPDSSALFLTLPLPDQSAPQSKQRHPASATFFRACALAYAPAKSRVLKTPFVTGQETVAAVWRGVLYSTTIGYHAAERSAGPLCHQGA